MLVRDLATEAGDEVNVDIASKVVQRLGGLRKELVLDFPEIIKSNFDLVKNRFVVPLENVADCMKDNSSTFGTSLGPNTCSKLIKFVIFG